MFSFATAATLQKKNLIPKTISVITPIVVKMNNRDNFYILPVLYKNQTLKVTR